MAVALVRESVALAHHRLHCLKVGWDCTDPDQEDLDYADVLIDEILPRLDPPGAAGASEFEEIRGAREDQLRQLLSHCRTQAYGAMDNQTINAYTAVADRLAKILDGES